MTMDVLYKSVKIWQTDYCQVYKHPVKITFSSAFRHCAGLSIYNTLINRTLKG